MFLPEIFKETDIELHWHVNIHMLENRNSEDQAGSWRSLTGSCCESNVKDSLRQTQPYTKVGIYAILCSVA